MTSRLLVRSLAAALLSVALLPSSASAAVEDLPGMDSAASMRDWLKLSDAQVAQLKPVIATRLQKIDAALTKFESAEEPNVVEFIEETGKARKEFDEGVAKILTPPQAAQWASFKAEFEKDLAQSAAKRQVAALQPALKLTDDQAKRMVPPMAVATGKKLEVLRKLGDGKRISFLEKIRAKRSMKEITEELDKALAGILSPDQMSAYKAATEKKK